MPATHGRIQVRAWLDSFASKRGKTPGGQKTPPFARAKRRGRNREKANSTGRVSDNAHLCQSFFGNFYKMEVNVISLEPCEGVAAKQGTDSEISLLSKFLRGRIGDRWGLPNSFRRFPDMRPQDDLGRNER